jgi:hypothetical protein
MGTGKIAALIGCIASAALACACGNTDSSGGATSGAGGSAANGGATGGVPAAASGGAGSGGTTANGGTVVTGGVPSSGGNNTTTGGTVATGTGGAPVLDANTVSVQMDEFTVNPGQEVFMCQDFVNPFGGQDVAVGRSESEMAPGSHHLHVYYGANEPADTRAVPCQNPFEFRPMIHLAATPHFVSEYPVNTAAMLKGQTGLRMQAHYLNTTADPIVAKVVVKLTKVDPASIQHWVGQMHFSRSYLQIAPGKGQVLKTSCKVPDNFGPIQLLSGISHMHKRGVHFVATTSTGQPLMDTNLWDEAPPRYYDPPVTLAPGDTIDWTCTYDNDTGKTLEFGDSAEKNEMCIYIARFTSSPNGDDLECETPSASGTAISQPAPNH